MPGRRKFTNGIEMRGRLFAVMRPNGRLSRYVFWSPFRAAQHVMDAAKVQWWPELVKRGVTIVAVEE